MNKLFYLLFAFSGCLFVPYRGLSDLAIAQRVLPDRVPDETINIQPGRVPPPINVPPDRVPGETINVPPDPVLDGELSTNVECNNISISSNDICIFSNSLSSQDKELLSDLIEKVFRKNVIYQEVN